MKQSIWNQPLKSLYRDLAEPAPAPAAVTAAAVSARMGLALLIKVLEVAGRRKNFGGDRERLRKMIEAARVESLMLAEAADEDIVAGAEQRRSEVPLKAAHAAEAGLALCAEARGVVTGAVAADLEAAALLLEAGVRAIQVCVRSNQSRP